MRITLNDRELNKMLTNVVDYSLGFVDGIQRGKNVFLKNLGLEVIEVMKSYIDSNARLSPDTMHHVYEWYRTGSPEARLFDLNYTVSNLGLSVNATFRQSDSIKRGSTTPFYNKASIMERGVPVTIRPKRAEALRFEVDGQEIFSRGPVKVENPGGNTEKGFERVFDSFMNSYFRQSFIRNSGVLNQFNNPVVYKKNLPRGAKSGKNRGIQTGYRWVANMGVSA